MTARGWRALSVPVELQPAFKAGTLRMLFRGSGYLGTGNYEVAPDGQHLLMIKEKEAPASSKELSSIVHWADELKRLAPAGRK